MSISKLIENVIIYFPIIFSSFIIYNILNEIRIKRIDWLFLFIYSLAVILFISFLPSKNAALIKGLFFILTSAFLIIISDYKNFLLIPSSIISIGIAYCLKLIGELLISFLSITPEDTIIGIMIAIINILLAIVFVRIKRLKNCFKYFNDINKFGIGLIISGFVFSANIFIQTDFTNESNVTLIILGFIISFIGLVFWIQKMIKEHYIRVLQEKANQKYSIDILKRNIEIEKLLNENTSLSSIIHLDNHIINKLEATLENYKNNKSIDNLRALTKQRNEYVNNKIISDKLLPTTGNNDIDAVISDMYIKAASRGIDFTLTVDCDINYLIHNIIEHADFEELISCCITNSIVDIENNPNTNGKILITISKPNDIYELTIMDNGISNDENIKSISEIIEKSKASIKTNEFDNNDSFTKSLTIRFDGLKNNTELS